MGAPDAVVPAADKKAEVRTEPLRFRLEPGEVLIVEKYQDIRIQHPRGRTADREEKNKIVLKVTGREGDAAQLEGTFTTYTRMPARTGVYRFDRRYFSRFKIHADGRYQVPAQYVMPNLRDLPTFPEHRPAKGEIWKKPAVETMHVGSTKIYMPTKVTYQYTGIQPLPAESGPAASEPALPRIQYVYTINKRVTQAGAPIRHITGFSSDALWFNEELGIPRFDSNRLAYTFTMFDGSKVNYRFRILSWYRKQQSIKPAEKTKLVEEVQKDLEKKPEVSVKKEKDGIRLTLNSVLFGFDSARLTDDAKRSISEIATVLRKHPNREIRISGHTDNRGSRNYNRKLSTARARSVLQELKEQGIEAGRMSFKGYGESKPVESNQTEAGRARNRRVEILIVTE